MIIICCRWRGRCTSAATRTRSAFFFTCRCPPPEILTALPNHEQLIPALGHYDLVGFQTEIDAANFSRYLESESHLTRVDADSFAFGEQVVRIGVFPVGVETEAFARLARRAIESGFVTRGARQPVGPRHDRRRRPAGLFQGSLEERFLGFERFLADNPDLRREVLMLQIAPLSRDLVDFYQEIRGRLDALSGRINGEYADIDRNPVRYVNKNYRRDELAGVYRAAKVGLVTPMRDGMNLVAKEFVAAQNPDDPGVLILSRFAGAADQLKDALLVNPYDPGRRRHCHQPRAVDAAGGCGASARRRTSGCWRRTI